MSRRLWRLVLPAALTAATACGGAARTAAEQGPVGAAPSGADAADESALIPAGYGSLR